MHRENAQKWEEVLSQSESYRNQELVVWTCAVNEKHFKSEFLLLFCRDTAKKTRILPHKVN